ncbi:MAG TPA: glycosyltransferase family 87 protein [bacterium]|nr:glycosyltransferase family 87 protein [bacterium]
MRLQSLRWLALLLFVSGALWVAAFSVRQIQGDLQQDFDVFYCAGLSVHEGYSPYDNNMDKDFRTWDGNNYTVSGFLFPPLTARLFVPFSFLSYGDAKAAWTWLTVLCIGLALALVTRLVWPQGGWTGLGAVLGVAFWYFPTLFQLHNENIDAQTFLVLAAGFALAYRHRSAWGHAAFGACLALAVVLKLDTLLMLPGVFLLRWRPAIAGFVLGGCLLGAGSLLVDGAAVNQDYFFNHLGRIFQSENRAGADQEISLEKLDQVSPGYPAIQVKDGVNYTIGMQQWLGSASGTGLLASHSHGHRLLVMVLTPLLLWGLAYLACAGGGLDPTLAFYLFGLLITLFCAPFTWTQRMFWVLPLLPWLLRGLAAGAGAWSGRPALWAGLLCLAVIGLPVPVVRGLGFYYCLPTLVLILLLARLAWRPATAPASMTAA